MIYLFFSLLWTCFEQDICGIICAAMTWLLILYAEFVVMVVIILPSPYPVYSTINMVIFNLLAFLAYASHIRTMFSDPVSIDGSNCWLVGRHPWIIINYLLLGSCAKGQCHKRNDSTIRFQGRSGIFQVPKMLQHQTRTCTSLLGVPKVHSQNGPSLSMVIDELFFDK